MVYQIKFPSFDKQHAFEVELKNDIASEPDLANLAPK